MVSYPSFSKRVLLGALSLALLASCIHKKYETPIAKNTQQPDKVLFDQAIKDIEHGRYEVARISLQTLMTTYESSEYMAKAKLAVADSWYREGGSNGLAQAEAEYKDFILFYPNMEEAAEAQNRVCQIHYKQIDKSDRDWSQALRAEDECRALLVQFPNSKFAPQTAQLLRNIQESLAGHEFVVGNFYWKRDMNPAAANRLSALVDQYPLYSGAGEALFEAGDSYAKMGPRFRREAGEEFAKIVKEYPLSARAKDAQKRLEDMEMPVPQADPNALAREKYELANYKKPGLVSRSTEWLSGRPDVDHAAKAGTPTMTDPKATIPVSVPVVATVQASETASAANGTTDVTATRLSDSGGALDKQADARSAQTASTAAAQQGPLPTNRDKELKKLRAEQAKRQAKLEKKKKKNQDGIISQQEAGQSQQNQSNATQGAQTPTGTPAASTPAAAAATNPPAKQPPSSQQ